VGAAVLDKLHTRQEQQMSDPRRRQFRQDSEAIEAEPNRRKTIHHIIEARRDLERAWAKYFGITLHEALWPHLYVKWPSSDKR
jgi:hypothetical protein